MSAAIIASEHWYVLEIASEYQSLGYDVIVAPSSEQLPNFLHPFQLDMIARNSQENVVVAIRTRSSLQQAPKLDEIAKAVEGQSNWRLDLIVTKAMIKEEKNPCADR